MNRLIKFRIWDKKRNKFVKEAFTGGFDSAEIKITLNGKLTWECEYGDGVIDGIIQQFIGLFDKNNKEIYEGDIIQYSNPFNYKWVNEIKFVYGSFTLDGLTMNTFSSSELEVIGNIFETPKLLK